MENPETLSGGTISPFRLWPFVFDHLQDGEFSSVGNAFAIRANDGDWITDFYRCAWVEECFLENAFAVRFQCHDRPVVFNHSKGRSHVHGATFSGKVVPYFHEV